MPRASTAHHPPPTLELERHLSLQVWALAEAFKARLEHDLAPLGLSASAFRLVGELMRAPGGLRHGELARRLGVKPPSVTAMVARLEAAGVVTTRSEPGDARATRVQLRSGAPLGPGVEVLRQLDQVLAGDDGRTARAELSRVVTVLLARLGEGS
ncbi:MAG: MarR family transcriptional regulator [Myxococcaceae bacterium]|nr:MarR family transcriptional regulator [Myxococcaceae bacterium]